MVMMVQMMCQKRHCLLACAYEQGVGSFPEAKAALNAMVTAGPFNNYCALCGDAVLHFEEAPTRFQTMIEAVPFLTEQMLANLHTREVMEKLGMTYEQQRRN